MLGIFVHKTEMTMHDLMTKEPINQTRKYFCNRIILAFFVNKNIKGKFYSDWV